jgi:hypothetical protein
MKRFLALLRTTWWLWLLYVLSGIALYVWVDPVFVVCFPIYFFTFLYFAYIRFDENGVRRRVD